MFQMRFGAHKPVQEPRGSEFFIHMLCTTSLSQPTIKMLSEYYCLRLTSRFSEVQMNMNLCSSQSRQS